MAADNRKPFFLFRPKFLLFCLYVAAYVLLRKYDEIAFQQINLPGGNGGVQVYRMVAADPHIPYWRQQLWRGVFSAAMVFEEEGQAIIVPAGGLIGRAWSGSGGGDLIDRAVQAGRNLLPNQAPRQTQPETQYYAPVQQQQQQPQQFRPQPSPEGLNEGERMIYDPRVQRFQ